MVRLFLVVVVALAAVLSACGDVHESSLVEVSARHEARINHDAGLGVPDDALGAAARRFRARQVDRMTAALAESARARWLEAAAWAQLAKNAEAVAQERAGFTPGGSSVLGDGSPASVQVRPASATSLTDWYADGYDWRCIAQAETGSDWHAHGPAYSTAFGISTGASEQTPASLAGTATPEEQLAIAVAVERRAGIHAWASNTVRKCGIA